MAHTDSNLAVETWCNRCTPFLLLLPCPGPPGPYSPMRKSRLSVGSTNRAQLEAVPEEAAPRPSARPVTRSDTARPVTSDLARPGTSVYSADDSRTVTTRGSSYVASNPADHLAANKVRMPFLLAHLACRPPLCSMLVCICDILGWVSCARHCRGGRSGEGKGNALSVTCGVTVCFLRCLCTVSSTSPGAVQAACEGSA